jgi:1,4-alpha-glucan branching enzyme
MKGVYSMSTMTKKLGKNRQIHFKYNNGKASSALIAGDFNSWGQKKLEMKKIHEGTYRKSLLLPPGTYEYKFLVDGRWENDPLNELTAVNCFGTLNNVIHVRDF